jgi:hypothetical protein
VVFEAIEVRRPELAVRREPIVELCERLRPDAIQATLRICARLDEARVLEDAEMFGHARLAEAEAVDEFADWPFAVAEQIEERQPARLSENLERSKLRHQATITI